MSIRSAIVNTARAAPRQAIRQGQVAPRRAASTGPHKTGSNTPWMLGSAAVFGSLTAFILMPAGDKAAEVVHDNIDAKGAGAHVRNKGERPEHEDEEHSKARDLMRKERDAGERPTLDEDPKGKMVHAMENRARTEIPSKRDDAKPMHRGASTGANFDGTVGMKYMTGGVNNAGAAPDAQDEAGGDKKVLSKTEKPEQKEEKEVKEKKEPLAPAPKSSESSSSSSSDAPSNVDDSDKPSSDSIKESLRKAEEVAVPKAAMAHETESSSTEFSSPSGSIQPDNVDDSDKPSDKEIKDSIKQAERSNSPLATMAEEVEEAK